MEAQLDTRYMIRLIDGVFYDPWAPSGRAPSPATIGHQLAMLCRYGGAVTRFYSVAEHCIWVGLHLALGGSNNVAFKVAADGLAAGDASDARWAAVFKGISRNRARLGLLGFVHDGPEGAGLVDVPGPIGRRPEMAPYKAAHERCFTWLCGWWGIPWSGTMPPEVKIVDRGIRGAELAVCPVDADGQPVVDARDDLPLWPNLDLAGRHDLSRHGKLFVRDAWVAAVTTLIAGGF